MLIISLALAIAAVIVYFQTPPLDRILKAVSGSMCVAYDGMCPGRQSPSEPTLHIGDYVVFEEVNPRDLNTDYPDSDIIVFSKSTQTDELIMHRIVATEERDGILYFYTKGDGNGINKWPAIPERTEYDPWRVPEDLIVGKVTNYNLPFPLLVIGFWALLAVSVATLIAASVLFASSR